MAGYNCRTRLPFPIGISLQFTTNQSNERSQTLWLSVRVSPNVDEAIRENFVIKLEQRD